MVSGTDLDYLVTDLILSPSVLLKGRAKGLYSLAFKKASIDSLTSEKLFQGSLRLLRTAACGFPVEGL